MELLQFVAREGGVVHRASLREQGFSRSAVERSGLVPIGRLWLAAPGTSSLLREAAAHRGRLACASAASHRGLAMRSAPELLHLRVGAHANVPIDGVRLHRSAPLAPGHRLIESVPDTLAGVARCLPRLDALVVWESALHEKLLTPGDLRRIPWPAHVARIAAAASPQSESILETVMLHGLRDLGLPVRQQVQVLGRRVDFVVGRSLIVETDGLSFHTGEQRRRDLEFDARAALEGVHVLRFDTMHVLERWPFVEETVRRFAAQGYVG
ncbi:MAG: DUF559 domain-containing protein [Microbacteriaceae bacterium]|nr:DUF559 domain-containing protein [Microbacteriaceae bacterium]